MREVAALCDAVPALAEAVAAAAAKDTVAKAAEGEAGLLALEMGVDVADALPVTAAASPVAVAKSAGEPDAPASDALGKELKVEADEGVEVLLDVPAAAAAKLALPPRGEAVALTAKGGLADAASEGDDKVLTLPHSWPPLPPALVPLGESEAEGEAARRGEAEAAALVLGEELGWPERDDDGEKKELRESLAEGERVPGALMLRVDADEADTEVERVEAGSVRVGREVTLRMAGEEEGEGDPGSFVGVPSALVLALPLKEEERVEGKTEADDVALTESATGGEALGESVAVGLPVGSAGDCEGLADAEGDRLAALLRAAEALKLGLAEEVREGAPLALCQGLAVEEGHARLEKVGSAGLLLGVAAELAVLGEDAER